jgi:DNA helicase-2/ATP-dependent DNA helicase PcrA
MDTYGSSYATPGWQRAKQRGGEPTRGSPGSSQESQARRGPVQIEGELIASSSSGSAFAQGARVFHTKFGPGTVAIADGNKLTVDFDKAGRKMVPESFVEAG